MSKLTDTFKDCGVFNATEFYNGSDPSGQVYIEWTGSDGRSPIGFHWTVRRRGYRTAPRTAPWYAYGNKTFGAGGGGRVGKAEALAEAQAWAAARYGIAAWKRDPYGSYGAEEFVEARIRELKTRVEREQP